MKRWIALVLFAAFLTAAPGAVGVCFAKTKIAVLDFTLRGERFGSGDMGAAVAQRLAAALVEAGRFDVVEGGANKEILNGTPSTNGTLDDGAAAEIGRRLGVEAAVYGSVLKLRHTMEINARIIDIETGSIRAAENVKSTASTRLQDLVARMADKITRHFPLEGYIVSKLEKIVSIDVGRLAGATAGMEFIVYKEGEVIRHPKTGDILDVEQIRTGRVVLRKIRAKLSEGEVLEEYPPGAITYGQMVYSVADKAGQPPGEVEPGPVSEKARLYVYCDPPSARVRILNVAPLYYAGIELDPGSYQIEVSAPGHRTAKQWIQVAAGEGRRVDVALVKNSPLPAPPQSRPSSAMASDADLPENVRYHIRMLRSGSDRNIVKSSKKIVRMKPIHPAILDTAESVLLDGYRHNSSSYRYVDAMSWLCNVLGASKNGQYRRTLQTVAAEAPSNKLKKYAGKNLKKLQ